MVKELIKFHCKKSDGTSVEFLFMSPTRQVIKDGEMVFAKTYADCLRKGLLTNAEVIKQNESRGGVFTEDEQREFSAIIGEILEKEAKLALPETTTEEKITLGHDIRVLHERYRSFKSRQESLFALTAESKARDQLVYHYALALTQKDGKNFFDGANFESRMINLEKILEDSFVQAVYNRAVWYSTAYLSNVEDLSSIPYPDDEVDAKVAEELKANPPTPAPVEPATEPAS